MLIGKQPNDNSGDPIGIQPVFDTSGDGVERQKALIASGIERALSHAQIDALAFAIMLAKIAHGYAVYEVGLDGFIPLLPSIIRGEDQAVFHYVGGTHSPMPTYIQTPTNGRRYQIAPFQCENGGQQYLCAQIRLFATVRPLTPVYTVVFGQPLA
jgi:hypothetical protein